MVIRRIKVTNSGIMTDIIQLNRVSNFFLYLFDSFCEKARAASCDKFFYITLNLYESIHQGLLVLGGVERRVIVVAVVDARSFLEVFLVFILVGVLLQQLGSVFLVEVVILLLFGLAGHHD